MTLLLDTHTFLWYVQDDEKLSREARALISAAGTRVLVSIVSLWEIGIKSATGKLGLPDFFEPFVRRELDRNRITILDLDLDHVIHAHRLPLHHRDPFDRMLAAQSLAEGIPLVGRDRELDAYGVDRRW